MVDVVDVAHMLAPLLVLYVTAVMSWFLLFYSLKFKSLLQDSLTLQTFRGNTALVKMVVVFRLFLLLMMVVLLAVMVMMVMLF